MFALSYVLPVVAAKLISILVSFVINFSLSHFVVYRKREQYPPFWVREFGIVRSF